MPKAIINFILSLLKGTAFEPLANDIEADVAAGKIDTSEVETFAEDALGVAEKFWPKDSAVAEDLKGLIILGDKTYKDIEALKGAPPAPAP